MAPMPDSIEWVELSDANGRTYFWNRPSQATVWKTPPGVQIVCQGGIQILGAVPSLLGHVRSWLVSLYGPSYLAVTCSLFWLVQQWILVTSVYSGFLGRLLKMFRF